jgi:hypothetical protein
MPEVSYYVCDGPTCENSEPLRILDGNHRPVEGTAFTRVEVKVARWPGLKAGPFRYCSQRCLVQHLTPGVPLAGEYVS